MKNNKVSKESKDLVVENIEEIKIALGERPVLEAFDKQEVSADKAYSSRE